jgi:hypothetical protein
MPGSAPAITPAAQPAGRPTRIPRRVLILISAIVAVAAIVITYLSTRNDTPATTPTIGSHGAAPTRTANNTCALEVNVLLDVENNREDNAAADAQAVGSENPTLQLMFQVLPRWTTLVNQVGVSDAERQIPGPIRRTCASAGNPLLTRGQRDALEQIATTQDANLLATISRFS